MSDASARPMVGAIRTEQEHSDLLTYHLTLIRKEMAAVETAKGPVDEAKAELSAANEGLTKAFNAAKGDLGRGYTREYLQSLIVDGKKRITELVEFEKMRARDKAAISQPVFGLQPELFPGEETPQEAKDELAWEAEGYQRGLRGDLEELQDGDPPRFHQAIMRGYEQGQRVTGERVARAMELKKAQETPDAGAEPKNLNDIEPGTVEHEAMLEASEKLARETLGDGKAHREDADEDAAIQRAKESLGVKDPKPSRRAQAVAGVH
jgi:hypothetical protein